MSWTYRPTGRSIPCDGEQLRHFRYLRGWTQEELAALSRFTPRLVAKAEASGSLHPDTIEALAATLSTPTDPVYPEDLIFSPKAAVRTFLENYAQHERQCVSKSQHLLNDEMTLWAPGNPDILPFAGERQSIDGFDEFWGDYFGMMERSDKRVILDSMQLVAEGNKVVCMTQELAHTKKFGPVDHAPPFPLCFVFTFERGKLTRFEDHFNAQAVEATLRILQEISVRKGHGEG